MNYAEIITQNNNLKNENALLKKRNEELTMSVEWFKKQIFGTTSEKIIEYPKEQLLLFPVVTQEQPSDSDSFQEEQKESKSKKTPPNKKKAIPNNCGKSGLRFTDKVEIVSKELIPDEIKDLQSHEYEILGYDYQDKLCQRKTSTYVVRYKIPKYRIKQSAQFIEAARPTQALPGTYADNTFLAGMIIDKCIYHQPLYRIHQKLQAAGVTISRNSLTHYVHATADLLQPVYNELVNSILESDVLTMDEKPIKAQVNKAKRRMKTGYFWPIMGDKDEVAFPFSQDRSYHNVKQILSSHFSGVLLTDDYGAYEKYCKQLDAVTHALCWSHTRRNFYETQNIESGRSISSLAGIAQLYRIEDDIQKKQLKGDKKLEYRTRHSRILVERLFEYWEKELEETALLPKNPYRSAVKYAVSNRAGLEVFLQNPRVPLDTNHIERQNRVVAIGQRNWLFCMTEVGAESLGVLYSLLLSAKMQGLNLFDYFTDVLNRIPDHPNDELHLLTPRLWKLHKN